MKLSLDLLEGVLIRVCLVTVVVTGTMLLVSVVFGKPESLEAELEFRNDQREWCNEQSASNSITDYYIVHCLGGEITQ
jgi:hypothetical protein